MVESEPGGVADDLLFPRFLDAAAEYDATEAFWSGVWSGIIAETGAPPGDWRSPWFENVSGDGTKFRDGNPIFSAVCDRRKLGVRILQFIPEPGDITADHWTDTAGDPDEGGTVKELVISCALYPSALPVVRGWLRDWVAEAEGR